MLGTQQGTEVQAMRFTGSTEFGFIFRTPNYLFRPHLSPQGDADLLHLLGAHIVRAHDEALGVPGKGC